MTTFDQIAPTRPRLQRDVLFTETPQGVLFHNSKGGFHLNSGSAYRFASLVVPHLDGRASVAELGGGLGEAQRSMMATLVSSLLERGFARDVAATGGDLELDDAAVTERFGAQLNYIDHYVDDASRRFERFRSARVAVLGTGDVATWCVRALVRNGASTLVADVAGDPEVGATVAELAAAGVTTVLQPLDAGTGPRGWADLGDVDVVVVAGTGAVAQAHRLEAEAGAAPSGVVVLPAWVIGRRSVIGPIIEPGSQTTWAGAVRALGRGRQADEAAVWEQVAQPALGSPVGPEGPMAAMIGNHLAYEVFRAVTGCLPAETRGGVVIQDLDSLDVVAEGLLPDPALPTTRPLDPDDTIDWTLLDPPYDAHAHEGAADEDPVAVALNQRSRLVQQHTGLVPEFTDDAWTQTPLKLSSATLSTGRDRTETLVVADIDHVAAARLRVLDRVAVRHAATARTRPTRGRSLADAVEVEAPATGEHTGHAAGGTLGAATVRALARAVAHRGVVDALRGAPVHRVDLDACLTQDAVPGTRRGAEVTFLLRSAELLGVELEVLEVAAPAGAARVALVRSPSHRDVHAVAAALDLPTAVRDAVVDVVGTVQARTDAAGTAAEPASCSVVEPVVPALDPWTLQVRDDAGTRPTAPTWEESVTRLAVSGLSPVAVRTTTAALAPAGVETVAVTLVEDGSAR
ncbi:transcriptional activator protein [Nocardioides dongxiaopingii]|uniref:transcriptional activator protein n=1 Tax=Nocardioides sp. S-1144 TaxID=2582905 RepID=UPI001163FB9B|nr:transcriptional activator protein [Nocardioides sp. S-1144]QCW49578.2 transcriptional activator protein [Nocardioides sp. S-1144]